MKISAIILAGAFLSLSGQVWADEIRVKEWPKGVKCAFLEHKSDGSWALADVVIGPDGTRHYPNPDRDSRDNKYFTERCNSRHPDD
jgi:hypothetical protein